MERIKGQGLGARAALRSGLYMWLARGVSNVKKTLLMLSRRQCRCEERVGKCCWRWKLAIDLVGIRRPLAGRRGRLAHIPARVLSHIDLSCCGTIQSITLLQSILIRLKGN